MNWIKSHGAAFVALAGAVGAFVGVVEPNFAAESADVIGGVGVVAGIVGAVVHAYVQGAGGKA